MLTSCSLFDVNAPKKAVNLTANADLVSIAKQVGLNLSETLEEGLTAKLRKIRTEEWLERNKQAIEDYNTRIETHGLQGMKYRRF
jgi:antitoxin CcdA